MSPTISHELRDLSLAASPLLLHRLKALGVAWPTIARMGHRHYFGGSARVIDIDEFERHSWEDEVRLWASPLDWLRADCDGLCILDWSAPEVLELARLPSIRCQDKLLAERLREALSRPYRLPIITFGQELRDAA
jgi:hypothetical protein